MSAWGPGIFADELAKGVRTRFADLAADGLSPEAATARLLEEYGSSLASAAERPVVFLALAAAQWKLGRVEAGVRERALALVGSGEALAGWAGTPQEAARREALEALRLQLGSEPPPPKPLEPRARSPHALEVGDVWRYRLPSGAQALLRVVGQRTDRLTRSPRVELLGASVAPVQARPDELARLPARAPLTPGPTAVILARWAQDDVPLERLALVARDVPVRAAGPDEGSRIAFWRLLDGFLRETFGLA